MSRSCLGMTILGGVCFFISMYILGAKPLSQFRKKKRPRWGSLNLQARPSALHVQGVRRGLNLRAQPSAL